MKKAFQKYAIIWAIFFVVFNVIGFVTPGEVAGMNKFGGAFWSGYVFISLAFIGQLVCTWFAFKADSLQKLFYNLPLIRISYTGLVVMIIVGAVVMAVPNLPNWIGVIICLLTFAFYAVAVVKASVASDAIENVDKKIKTQTFFIKSLIVDAESLMARAKDDTAKAACKKVYEAVRYSDPMSNDALAGTESQITLKFAAFSDAVQSGSADIPKLADELTILLNDRNKRCKLLK